MAERFRYLTTPEEITSNQPGETLEERIQRAQYMILIFGNRYATVIYDQDGKRVELGLAEETTTSD